MSGATVDSKRILVAEDDLVSRRLVEIFLKKWGYEARLARDGREAWRILSEEDAPRIALLDWMMPELEGVEICRRLREWKNRPYTYVVLLTARGHKQDRLTGLQAGADDFLTKPFDQDELRARLNVASRIIELQDELIRAREQMRYQATHDSLTGVANRPEVLERLASEIARSRRSGERCSVALADLDHFKEINDSQGHNTGDEVLRETARRIQTFVRAYDIVGRYGGEEFLLVLPGCGLTDAEALAERIRFQIASRPMATSVGPVGVSMSFGVAEWNTEEAPDPRDLLHAADRALYRAKAAGRNRVASVETTRPTGIAPPSDATSSSPSNKQ